MPALPDSRVVRALLSLGMVVGLGATGTYAYWTDQVPVSGTTITAGTIDLKVNNQNAVTDFTSMNVNTMVPGDSTAGVVTVTNSGTAPLKYWVDASASNADGKGLGAALTVRITGDSAVSGSGRAVTCAGAALSGSGTTFTTNLLGTPTTGRLLAAGQTESICIQATLPTNAASSLQAATTNVGFTFTGTSF